MAFHFPTVKCLDGRVTASGIQVVPEPARSMEMPSGPNMPVESVIPGIFIPAIGSCAAARPARAATMTAATAAWRMKQVVENIMSV
jgi:hypothetical protein